MVRHVAAMALADLKEIDPQKEKIERNTQQFVRGLPANNVLLTGATRHRQVLAHQGLPECLRGAGSAPGSRWTRRI